MTWHRFVPFHRVRDYLALGWIVTDALRGSHHGHHAAHLIWVCRCPPVEPVRNTYTML